MADDQTGRHRAGSQHDISSHQTTKADLHARSAGRRTRFISIRCPSGSCRPGSPDCVGRTDSRRGAGAVGAVSWAGAKVINDVGDAPWRRVEHCRVAPAERWALLVRGNVIRPLYHLRCNVLQSYAMHAQLELELDALAPSLTREQWETLKRIAAESPAIIRAAYRCYSPLHLHLLIGKAQDLQREAEELAANCPELRSVLEDAVEALDVVGEIAPCVVQKRSPREAFAFIDRDRALRDEQAPPPPQAAAVVQTPRERRARRTVRTAARGADDPEPPRPLTAELRAQLKREVDRARRKQLAAQHKRDRALFDGDPGRVS